MKILTTLSIAALCMLVATTGSANTTVNQTTNSAPNNNSIKPSQVNNNQATQVALTEAESEALHRENALIRVRQQIGVLKYRLKKIKENQIDLLQQRRQTIDKKRISEINVELDKTYSERHKYNAELRDKRKQQRSLQQPLGTPAPTEPLTY